MMLPFVVSTPVAPVTPSSTTVPLKPFTVTLPTMFATRRRPAAFELILTWIHRGTRSVYAMVELQRALRTGGTTVRTMRAPVSPSMLICVASRPSSSAARSMPITFLIAVMATLGSSLPTTSTSPLGFSMSSDPATLSGISLTIFSFDTRSPPLASSDASRRKPANIEFLVVITDARC